MWWKPRKMEQMNSQLDMVSKQDFDALVKRVEQLECKHNEVELREETDSWACDYGYKVCTHCEKTLESYYSSESFNSAKLKYHKDQVAKLTPKTPTKPKEEVKKRKKK